MLHLAPVSHAVAKEAVEKWHYSRKCPDTNLRYGVWEDGRFIGVVLYGPGVAADLGRSVGVGRQECRELLRVALDAHQTPVTRIISQSFVLLRSDHPGLKALVSYADSNQGHVGTIYQAGNWMYLGPMVRSYIHMQGKTWHPRTLHNRYKTQSIKWIQENIDPEAHYVKMQPKYKYAYAFDKKTRRVLLTRSLPYPKKEGLPC